MKIFLFTIVLLTIDPIGNLDRVAKRNALKKEAKEAFVAKDYKKAIEKYTYLIDSLQVEDDNILLNLANAYYKTSDSSNALSNYEKLTSSKDQKIKSVVNQQLGVMNNNPKNLQTSLDYFKKALKADPTNEEARYNYELVKKLLKEQEKQDQQNKDQDKKDQDKKDNKDQEKQDKKDNQDKEDQEKDKEKGENKDQEKKDQQNKDQEKQDQQKQDQEKSDEQKDKQDQEKKEGQQDEENKEDKKEKNEEMPPSTKQKLQEMKISPEKAKMILEAMKNQEVQYIQQSKKKARQRAKNNKPDW